MSSGLPPLDRASENQRGLRPRPDQVSDLLAGLAYFATDGERFRPAATPVKTRHVEDFIARVNESFRRDPLAEPAKAIMAVPVARARAKWSYTGSPGLAT